MQHVEIIQQPGEIWLAPVGEAYPDVDEAPAGNWAKLGSNGDCNLGEEGITITSEQTLAITRTLGGTGPKKVTRTEERLSVSGMLLDGTAEEVAKLMNNATVTDTAAGGGTPGYRTFNLRQGQTVSLFALLVRAENGSAYDETLNGQWEIPAVFNTSNMSPALTKGDPAGWAFEFEALEDENAATDAERFGIYNSQDAVAV